MAKIIEGSFIFVFICSVYSLDYFQFSAHSSNNHNKQKKPTEQITTNQKASFYDDHSYFDCIVVCIVHFTRCICLPIFRRAQSVLHRQRDNFDLRWIFVQLSRASLNLLMPH